jgi:non-specific serine/threonine protein kinase
MTPEQWKRIEALYQAAITRNEGERGAFLAEACGGDEALRQEVQAMIDQPTISTTGLLGRSALGPASLGSGVGAQIPAGSFLGAYEVQEWVGRGGMGDVYRARDSRLKRDVAIKILRADVSFVHDRGRRFQREAQAIASLNHPHVCILHDIGEQDGFTYLVFEYVDGPTLQRRLLEHGPLPLDEALEIASHVADALREAHRHGIVHRDIKPGNIKLSKSGAKLLDFGLARNFDHIDSSSTSALTGEGAVLGTPCYMSPEQARGQPVDGRTDIFSLGAVIYEMLAGSRLFDGANAIEMIDAVLHKHPQTLSLLNPAAPAQLDQLVTRCLEKDKDRRYQTVDDLLTDLANVSTESPTPGWTRSRATRRHNLPLELTSFIGRESEVTDVSLLLSQKRLLTLSGSGGCGKTRLALRVAANVTDKYRDGVWLVEMAPVSNNELIQQCVASALGIQEEREQGRPLLQQLLDYLETKQLLLVFDNCEHLVVAIAQVVEAILTSCERVHVLATSREPLRIAGEHLWRVPSLSLPDAASVSPSEISQYEAVRLFTERAPYSLQLDDANANCVVEICRRLDGIPLAIEMAAARLDVLSLNQLIDRLKDCFGLLRNQRRLSPRQDTLRSVIDWSYDLLTPEEQTLFRRVAVFAGSFSLDAVEAVCVDKRLKSDDVLAILSRLVEKSMVTITRTHLGVRYRLLETVWEYARLKFSKASDELRTRKKHVEFFLGVAERRPKTYSRQTALWFDRLEQEHQNLLAALEWCNTAKGQSQTVLRFANALQDFWYARGYLELGKEVMVRALDRDRRQAPTPVLIEALKGAGDFLSATGELDAARSSLQEALGLAEESGDQAGVAAALTELGHVALNQGKYVEADRLYCESLVIGRKNGSQLDIGAALNNLGILAFFRGDDEQAQSCWQESQNIFREQEFEPGLAASLTLHAALANDRLDYKRAEALCIEALAIARRTGNKGNVAHALSELGCKYAFSDYQRSRTLFEQALVNYRDFGHKGLIAVTLSFLSDISRNEGDYAEAGRLVEEAFALFKQIHEHESPNASVCLTSMGWLAFEQGLFDKALELCQRILSFEGSKMRRSGVLQLLGWARMAQGDREGARAAFEERLMRTEESRRSSLLAASELGMGYLDLLDGHVREAQTRFQTSLSVYEKGNNKTGLVNALLALGDAALLEDRIDNAGVLYLRALRLARDLGFKKGVVRAVRGAGVVASRENRPELAARCFGAASASLETIQGTVPSFHSIGYDSTVETVRFEVGQEQFQRLWNEGFLMTIDGIDALLPHYAPSNE